MKIFICCSKQFYGFVPAIREQLQKAGHEITPPNGFDEPESENRFRTLSEDEFVQWKAAMLREDIRKIEANDAVLVLNFEKNGQANYVGPATFLEAYNAWRLNKKLFLYNPLPENMLKDELVGLAPVVINRDLSKIR